MCTNKTIQTKQFICLSVWCELETEQEKYEILYHCFCLLLIKTALSLGRIKQSNHLKSEMLI